MNFGDFASDPVEELSADKLERALALREGLVAHCANGSIDSRVYRLLRREFMNDPATTGLLPRFIRTNQDTSSLWGFFKGISPHWEPRRQFVRDEFVPLLEFLEMAGGPADAIVSDALDRFDAEAVNAAWAKALARREADQRGQSLPHERCWKACASTSSKTMQETLNTGKTMTCQSCIDKLPNFSIWLPHSIPKTHLREFWGALRA